MLVVVVVAAAAFHVHISHQTSSPSRFVSFAPTDTHSKITLHVLRYLRGPRVTHFLCSWLAGPAPCIRVIKKGRQINQNVNNCKGTVMFLPKSWREIWPLITHRRTIALLVLTGCHSDRNITLRCFTQMLILSWIPKHNAGKPSYHTQRPGLQVGARIIHLITIRNLTQWRHNWIKG
jgi:hypothetical protein